MFCPRWMGFLQQVKRDWHKNLMSFCLFVCFLLYWCNFQIRFLLLQWWLAELGCRKHHHVSHWPNSSHPQPLHILLPLQHENTTFVLDIKRGNVCITGRLEHLSLLFPACSPIIHHHLSLLFPACRPIIHHHLSLLFPACRPIIHHPTPHPNIVVIIFIFAINIVSNSNNTFINMTEKEICVTALM